MIEVFGIAFSIMGLLPSIAATLTFSIPAGPVGMVWVSVNVSWFRDITDALDRDGFSPAVSYLSLVWPW